MVLVGLVALGCSSPEQVDAAPRRDPAVVAVGSFDFPESELLGELFAQALEREGLEVERHLGVGSRELAAPALELGRIDLLPEYVQSATDFLALGPSDATDPVTALAELREAAEPRGLTALEPSSAVDRNALAMRAVVADAWGIESVADLRGRTGLRFVAPPECPSRAACLPALEALGLHFDSYVPLPPGLPIALALKAEEADVGLVFSTDPLIGPHGLKVLDGTGTYDRAEQVVPLVRTEVLDRHGDRLSGPLGHVTSKLTTRGLMMLNGKVSRGESVRLVAREWLDSHR